MESNRLSPTCQPSHYTISLTVNIETQTYTGHELISLNISKPINIIHLHCRSPVLITKISNYLTSEDLQYTNKNNDIISISLQNEESNNLVLHITFQGRIVKYCKGFFISYKDNENMMSTQFEPNYTRKAFPCFDEPNFKSVFQLQITVDSSYIVISNMPGTVQKIDDFLNTSSFESSPLMPCYLLHWSICKHKSIKTTLGNTEIKVFSPNPNLSLDHLALAKDALAYYNQLFSLPYSLPKLDLISVFRLTFVAMENWGSITFQSSYLEKLPDDNQKVFKDSKVICHELAHMWFGNLVTPFWWNDLWLNESFASYLEYKCLASIRPEQRSWLNFVVDLTSFALKKDDPIKNSHPIEILDFGDKKVSRFFDSICYMKGASVLCMVEDFIGEKVLEKVFCEYLARYKGGNVVSQDFFNVLMEFTEVDVQRVLISWTRQVGLPLVEVRKIRENEFGVVQKVYDPENKGVWKIPIKYVTDNGKVGVYLLESEEGVIEIDAGWIKLNYQSRGFYRVLYDNYDIIFDNIRNLSAEDRLGLVQDIFSHYAKSILPFSIVHDLILALTPEYEFPIVNIITNFIQNNLQNPLISKAISKMLENFLMPLWDRFGYNINEQNSNPDIKPLKNLYCDMLLCVCKSEKVAKTILENVKNDPENKEKYYKSLLVFEELEETKNLAESSYEFSNYIFIYSENYDLIKKALNICLISKNYENSDIEKSLNEAAGFRHEKFFNDNFFKALIDEYVGNENEIFREEIRKIVEVYKEKIVFWVNEMIGFIEENMEKVGDGNMKDVLRGCLEKFCLGMKVEGRKGDALQYFIDKGLF